MGIIKTRGEIIAEVKTLQSEGKKVGYTSGTFDLLHRGHVEYLAASKDHCDVLIVGVNSDSSVKSYKDPSRPICSELDRMTVLAGLASVDFVFSFDETNNNINIELIKPDLYIKAGDYDPKKLSSAPIVESYGGKVLIIPFLDGRSTSGIIDRVLQSYSLEKSTVLPKEQYELRPAVFLDRDGTLNEHVEYLHEPEKFKIIDGVVEGLKKLQAAGFRLVIVTNQAGIGLGYFTKEDFYRVNKELFKVLGPNGIGIDRIYFSPYSKSDRTNCRKPDTGMVNRAVEDLNIDLKGSYVIGDTTTDIKLAENIGCPGILVRTGFAGEDGVYQVTPAAVVNNVSEAADYIVNVAHSVPNRL